MFLYVTIFIDWIAQSLSKILNLWTHVLGHEGQITAAWFWLWELGLQSFDIVDVPKNGQNATVFSNRYLFLVGRSLVDPAFGGSNKISLKLVRLQGRCAGEARCQAAPRAYDDQSIHAQTIMTIAFQEHTMTRTSMPKP